jgi:phosphoribosylanthranilate isomerase
VAEGTRVKICGLRRREDVLAADAFGADYVGVVLTARFARSVDPGLAAAILEGVAAVRVAVLVDETVASAEARGRAINAGILQLHGSEPPTVVEELTFRGWTIWKSVRARAPDDLLRAVDLYGALVEGILVEGWKEGIAGGAGAALDLEQFRAVRGDVPLGLEVILAGGLRPETVTDAVARFSPDVVDVSSGVEVEHGRKNRALLHSFIERARGAPRKLRIAAPRRRRGVFP